LFVLNLNRVQSLAQQLVEEIFEIIKDLNQREGVSFLLAE
jgi:branched-chain amino acid transport system ATP-binding protein